jgi:hypothetical protein
MYVVDITLTRTSCDCWGSMDSNYSHDQLEADNKQQLKQNMEEYKESNESYGNQYGYGAVEVKFGRIYEKKYVE